MGWTNLRSARRRKFSSSLPRRTVTPRTSRRYCILSFNSHLKKLGLADRGYDRMNQIKMLRFPLALLTLFLVCCVSSIFAQTSPAQTSPSQTSPDPQLATRDVAAQQASASAASFDQVDRK